MIKCIECNKKLEVEKMNIRDELIKIRTVLDYDVIKGKQQLTNLIKELEEKNVNNNGNGDKEWIKKNCGKMQNN